MSTGLTPDAVLVRAPDLVVRLTDDDAVRLELEDTVVVVASIALDLLVAFQHPTAVADAMNRVGSGSPARFVSASETIIQLHRAGALVTPGSVRRVPDLGFAGSGVHLSMLRDAARTRAFCDAIDRVVRPNDVVVDIGTGTGILATRAALAGARRVYAIESTGIADVAEAVFVANGIADRVTLLRGRSTEIDLPEPATVLVTELFGHDPLAEDLLDVVRDARKRLLAKNCRIIPSSVELVAIPIALEEELVARHVPTTSTIAAWRRAYGVDLSPLLERRGAVTESIHLGAKEIARLERLGAPVTIAALDLSKVSDAAVSATVDVALERRAPLAGVALTFRATLAEGVVLAPLLPVADAASHWKTRICLPPRDLDTREFSTVRVDFLHRRHGSDVKLHFLP